MGGRREVIVLCRFSACFLRVFCVFSACFLRVLSMISELSLSVLRVSQSVLWVCPQLRWSCSCDFERWEVGWVKISKKFRRLKDEESSLRLQAHHDQTIRMIFGWRWLLSPEQTTEPIHNMQVRHWNQTMTFDDDELINYLNNFCSSF